MLLFQKYYIFIFCLCLSVGLVACSKKPVPDPEKLAHCQNVMTDHLVHFDQKPDEKGLQEIDDCRKYLRKYGFMDGEDISDKSDKLNHRKGISLGFTY